MNIFVCSECRKELEADDLNYECCVHCGIRYEPIAQVHVDSRPVYDENKEEDNRRYYICTGLSDEAFAAMIRYGYRELSVDRIEAEGDPVQKQSTVPLRELNRRILFRDSKVI